MTTRVSPASDTTERNRLVEQHLYLVPYLARRFQGWQSSNLDLDDLLQEGYLGLMRAVERFDPHRLNPATGQPYQFSTYATAFIRGRMLWAIRTRTQGLSLPEHIAGQIAHLERVRREYWLQQQREPSVEELAAALERPSSHIVLLMEAQQVKSLDEAPAYYDEAEDEVKRLADLLVAPDPLPEREQQAEVSHLLQYLYPDERRIITCRYQLGQETRYGIDEIPVPYVEVARQLHLTRERVKALEARALRKMRYWAERPRFERGK